MGLHVVVLHVDGEQPERRDVAGVRRHQHPRDAEDVHQPAQQQRAGAAEGGEGEVADVEAALDGDLAQRVGLVPGGDLQDAGGTGLRGQVELLGQLLDAGAGGGDVERDLAAEQVGRDPAEHDVRVGDGDLGAALAVAERAGVRAGRLRADLEGALGREPGDGAAAGTDGDHVDHRDLRRVDAHAALGGERRLAADHHADVGGGAAAVAGEHLVEAGHLGDQRGTQGAGGRAREHGGDRLVHDLVGRQHAAVGLHHVERHPPRICTAVTGVRREPVLDVVDVAREPGLHGGVDEGGHRAFVLAVLAQHLAGDRDHRVGVLLGEDRAHPLLVVGVGVGVQEADAEGVDALRPEPAGRGAGSLLVEGPHLRAGEVEASADPLDVVARHDPRRLHPEVAVAVAVGHRLPGDLQHRVVPLGGEVAEPVHLPLEQLVGGHRGAVADRGQRGAVTGREAHQPEHLLDAGHEAVRGVRRGAGRLGGDQLAAVLVEGDDVGERATGVDPDADPAGRGRVCAHAPDSSGTTPHRATAHSADGRAIRWHHLPAPADPEGSAPVS